MGALIPFQNEAEVQNVKKNCYFIVNSSERRYLVNATTGRIERALQASPAAYNVPILIPNSCATLQGRADCYFNDICSVSYRADTIVVKTERRVDIFAWDTGFEVLPPATDASAMDVDRADDEVLANTQYLFPRLLDYVDIACGGVIHSSSKEPQIERYSAGHPVTR